MHWQERRGPTMDAKMEGTTAGQPASNSYRLMSIWTCGSSTVILSPSPTIIHPSRFFDRSLRLHEDVNFLRWNQDQTWKSFNIVINVTVSQVAALLWWVSAHHHIYECLGQSRYPHLDTHQMSRSDPIQHDTIQYDTIRYDADGQMG